jgi:hypothetical protein
VKTPEGTKHYFVDEAGDTTLFDAKGRVFVGSDGVSRTFMLGVADVPNPIAAKAALDSLRASLLADPYFRNVPSMQPERAKTAVAFHAKDDLPEVRREVFRLLPTLGVKVQVAIRRKADLVPEAQRLFSMGQRLTASDIYDDLVKRLFKPLMHRGEFTEVCFARRGKSDREQALRSAIERGRRNFRKQWDNVPDTTYHIRSSVPSQDAGLQIVDYYLWAVQRLYERSEDRYFMSVCESFSLIMDLDNKRTAPYGTWFTSRDPLTLEKIKPLES